MMVYSEGSVNECDWRRWLLSNLFLPLIVLSSDAEMVEMVEMVDNCIYIASIVTMSSATCRSSLYLGIV